MQIRNRKSPRKTDLLKLSDVEKMKLLKAVRQSLQQKAAEAKLWQSFVEAENLTINGEAIAPSDMQLKGIPVADLFRSR